MAKAREDGTIPSSLYFWLVQNHERCWGKGVQGFSLGGVWGVPNSFSSFPKRSVEIALPFEREREGSL
jgi:hypothetical protein